MNRIDVTNTLIGVQERIGQLDSASAVTQDMIFLLKYAEKNGSTLYEYPDIYHFDSGMGLSPEGVIKYVQPSPNPLTGSYQQRPDSGGFAFAFGESDTPPERIGYAVYENKVYFRADSSWQRLGPEIQYFGGQTAGYVSGGVASPSMPATNNIDEFSLVTDTNAVAVGDMSTNRYIASGQMSNENAYTSGGNVPTSPAGASITDIEKFPFAAVPVTSTSVGNLSLSRQRLAGSSAKNQGKGYAAGGGQAGVGQAVIDEFPFSSDTPATNVGSLAASRENVAGNSSFDNGYAVGGSTAANSIQKYPFNAAITSTNLASLTAISNAVGAGCSSPIEGFHAYRGPAATATIEKFAFSSETDATVSGSLFGTETLNRGVTGASSRDAGYVAGGGTNPYSNVIQKFSFYTNVDTSDIADLSLARAQATAQQV